MSKGNIQASNGELCSHLSACNPAMTPMPSAASNWVPRLAYRRRNRLLSCCCASCFLSAGKGGCLFITVHLHHIGPHVALSVKSGGGLHLQFACIKITGYHRIAAELQ